MLTTIRGTYSNGVIVLNEPPPTYQTSEVLITFTEEKVELSTQKIQKRELGFAKGTFVYVADDFDAPLDELKEYMP